MGGFSQFYRFLFYRGIYIWSLSDRAGCVEVPRVDQHLRVCVCVCVCVWKHVLIVQVGSERGGLLLWKMYRKFKTKIPKVLHILLLPWNIYLITLRSGRLRWSSKSGPTPACVCVCVCVCLFAHTAEVRSGASHRKSCKSRCVHS